MEFALSEEQRMLADSIGRFLEETCPLDLIRETAAGGSTKQPAVWSGLAELGVHGLLIPETHGGVGLGFLEASLTAEALGRTIAPIPFVGSAVMAPTALMAGGSEEQKETWLPQIAAGEVVFGVGVSEHVGRRETEGVVADDGKLTGKAMFVLDGEDADQLLIADMSGALHVVAVDAPGLTRTKLKTVDRTRTVSEIVLLDTPAQILPGSAGSDVVLRETIDAGRLILAADTLGAGEAMIAQAIAYARQRKQFNRVIGSFQAVKHMCAEMSAELEPCRGLVWYAAHAVAEIPEESRLMICHAKAHLAEVGKFVSRTATEVHGGMGFTDLLGLHYWFKRIGFNRQLLGAPELVREEAARAQGWI